MRGKRKPRSGCPKACIPTRSAKYENLEPVYAEYNVGHFTRTFTLSNKIDQDGISADLGDGVLTLTLRKAKQAMPRRIAIA